MRPFLIIFLFLTCWLSSNGQRKPAHNPVTINYYAPILSFNACENKILVEDITNFSTGDTVLIIQMKGALIDSSNTPAFGTITDYRNCGNFEFNYIKSISGNTVILRNVLTRSYDFAEGKVQLIKVPTYSNLITADPLTCVPWNGSTGGVLVFIVNDTLTLNAGIDVSVKGFRGGKNAIIANSLTCSQNGYYYDSASPQNARKGEGIASLNFDKWNGRGKLANGGGGGNGQNSGGGGGSNSSAGGFGGYQLDSCNNPFLDNRGIGGVALNYSNTTNRIFLGGGGGAGQVDSDDSYFTAEGGIGGGIIIIKARCLQTYNYSIDAYGSVGEYQACPPACHTDGMGGGGAGGTILLDINNYLDSLTIHLEGGDGIKVLNYPGPSERVGPGGGGSAGVVWFAGSIPPFTGIYKTGGTNGVIFPDAQNPYGATAGGDGIVLDNLALIFDTIEFVPNIDSVRIKDSATGCSSFDFKGFGYTNTNPISSWQWFFGDGGTANSQNTSHTYLTYGIITVKLVITDINGCKDSISKNVNSSFIQLDAGPADTICTSASTVLQAVTNGGIQFAWTPAIYLNDPTLLNPTATPPVTTTFYLTAANVQGCKSTDSVVITIRSVNNFSINPPVSICKNDSARLQANGGDLYSWTPGNSNLPAPVVFPATTTNYSVLITDTVCGNTTTLSTMVTVRPLPVIIASKSNDIDCSKLQSQLSALGAAQYSWSPAGSLTNPNSANPIATPGITTMYIVNGIDLNSCVNRDSINVKVLTTGTANYYMPSAFTPNNDGLNDCYGIKYWGNILELDFSIYDRWGERIFHTTNPSDCWNGIYKGVQLDPAVFLYMIKAKTGCQESVFRKGTFTLIR